MSFIGHHSLWVPDDPRCIFDIVGYHTGNAGEESKLEDKVEGGFFLDKDKKSPQRVRFYGRKFT